MLCLTIQGQNDMFLGDFYACEADPCTLFYERMVVLPAQLLTPNVSQCLFASFSFFVNNIECHFFPPNGDFCTGKGVFRRFI